MIYAVCLKQDFTRRPIKQFLQFSFFLFEFFIKSFQWFSLSRCLEYFPEFYLNLTRTKLEFSTRILNPIIIQKPILLKSFVYRGSYTKCRLHLNFLLLKIHVSTHSSVGHKALLFKDASREYLRNWHFFKIYLSIRFISVLSFNPKKLSKKRLLHLNIHCRLSK